MNTNPLNDRLREIKEEMEATQNLINDFPDFLPAPDRIVYVNSSLCEFSIRYSADNADAIRHTFKYWDSLIVPLYLTRGTFTSFRTNWHKPDKSAARIEKVCPVIASVSKHGVELSCYSMLSGHLLRVVVDASKMPEPLAQVRWEGVKKIRNVNLTISGFNTSNPPTYIKWASDSGTPNQYTIYWDLRSFKSIAEILK